MIYILVGNDTKKKNIYLKKICKEDSFIFDYKDGVTKAEIIDKAGSVSLFGDKPVIILDNFIKDKKVEFSDSDLSILGSSSSVFIFIEDKLLSTETKKYSKFAKIEEFNQIEKKYFQKNNIFDIADSFSRRDKINTWILYREAISLEVSPEEICGIIFWKVKDMIIKGNKFFVKEELEDISSKLVSIYHMAHRGEVDFVVALEQFILDSLNKNKKA